MLGIQGVVVSVSAKNTNLKRTPEKIFLQKFVLGLEFRLLEKLLGKLDRKFTYAHWLL